MSILPLGAGEFTLADKLQPAEYINDRSEKLKQLYGLDPELARGVISSVYPHVQKRPWEHSELQQQLGLRQAVEEVTKTSHFQKFAFEYLAHQFPSISAAMQAFQSSRAQQAAIEAQQRGDPFPALHAFQPQGMGAQQQMAYGDGSQQFAPVIRHRRHRHHYAG